MSTTSASETKNSGPNFRMTEIPISSFCAFFFFPTKPEKKKSNIYLKYFLPPPAFFKPFCNKFAIVFAVFNRILGDFEELPHVCKQPSQSEWTISNLALSFLTYSDKSSDRTSMTSSFLVPLKLSKQSKICFSYNLVLIWSFILNIQFTAQVE